MKHKKLLLLSLFTILMGCGAYALWRYMKPAKPITKPFSTLAPTKTTIQHKIYASGMLKIKDSIRVGSLISGLVKEILVEENDSVLKGQLLATLDNGKQDTSIQAAQGSLMQAQSNYSYHKALYAREKQLYEKGLRSDQEIERIQQQLLHSEGSVMVAQANLDVATIERDNTHIKAPDDGVIIAIGIKKGARVTTDLDATVLFEIAKDITKMEAELLLEESAAGHIKRGQKVTFTVDNHPHMQFKTTIKSVSYSPVKTHNGLMYRAIVDIDNKAQLLRPGMTIHATIKVAKKKDITCVENISFYLDQQAVAAVAKTLGYSLRPIPPAEKKELAKEGRIIKYLWVHEGLTFIEKAIETGIYDDRYVETINNTADDYQYLSDVIQPSEMDSFYQSMFKGAL